MIDIPVTIASIKAVAGVAKDAGRIDLYADIIGLQQSILEAIGENTTLAMANAELSRQVTELRQRISELEGAASAKESLVFRTDAYWRVKEGAEDEGPFCPKCYDGEGRVARMTDRGNGFTCCVVCRHCIGRARRSSPPRPHGSGWVNGY